MAGWWAWVQRHLDERGWTSSDLARHAKINRSIIGRWRDGAQPEVRTARALAVALGRPVLEVLVAAELLTPSGWRMRGVPTPRPPPRGRGKIHRWRCTRTRLRRVHAA